LDKYDVIRAFFDFKASIGVIGGYQSGAVYFVGYQNEDLIFLDPHKIQTCSDDASTYHNSTPKTIPIKHASSSMTLAFLL